MLSRSHRLTTRQFNEIMEKGRVFHSPLFLMRLFEAREGVPEKGARIAAVAPVKIAKTAVVRNRNRRRIYAAVRPLAPALAAGARIILIAKAPLVATGEIAKITDDLQALFVKAGILR